MNRKDALKTLMLLTGGTVFGANAFLSGCAVRSRAFSMSAAEKTLFDAFGSAILPGAGELAGFVETVVRDFYTDEETTMFRSGLAALKADGFADDRLLAWEASRHAPYLMLKQLAVWSWLTSPQAAAEAYRYDPVPGDFPTDVPYAPGDKVIFPRFGSGQAARFARFHSESVTSA